MQIRSIQLKDKAYFLDSVEKFYHSSAVDHPISTRNAAQTFDLLLQGTPYADCLIAEDETGATCGYCLLALTWSNEGGGLCVWLDELMIDETRRGEGIGQALIQAVREKYSAAARFRLEVTAANTRAAALYKRLGFEELPYRQMLLESR